ncbi:hypothetical protein CORC01_10327 [Colletotrichum orchidophilum]|uniref:Heterokaryon incompatibility domain-containing protein n=1 Tax=Colletotrichum orchidophilum TaxID=1209926 RepID=A0A1G4AZ04_9PEZI|nr:uncharacterized protein CORC01_10327 [Colletotrichum orchidophilum]OHE94399.1 hypothetical protein CORC01_10327 [Colletotrichum orchidophilum]
MSEWNSPLSINYETPFIYERDESCPPIGPGAVPDPASITDGLTTRRQREMDAHRAIMEWHARDLINTTWCQRGWTFQELISSRRQLIFHNDTVNWQCHFASWHEKQRHITTGPCSSVGEAQHHNDTSSSFVALCNKRVLTYAHDVHDAFAGVLSAFGQSIPGGFICGLPRIFFDAALLWQPPEPLFRRASDVFSALPSWSWMSPDEEDSRDSNNFWQPASWQTRRTVVWSYSLAVDGERVPVVDATADFTHDRAHKGWREEYCERAQKAYFTHPQAGAQEFWFPIPLAAMTTTPGSPPPCQPAYLQCLTRRGFIQISKLFQNRRTLQCMCATLCDPDGRWAGVLRLNASSSNSAEFHGAAVGETCELMEVSAGSVENQRGGDVSVDEWEDAECPRHTGTYDFVNVLWIEWVNGVAYRKALGRVWESALAGVAAEEAHITLG